MNAIRLLFIMLAMMVSAGAWATVDLTSVSTEDLVAVLKARIASQEVTAGQIAELSEAFKQTQASAELPPIQPPVEEEKPYPAALNEVLDSAPLLKDVPRDRKHIIVENIKDGPTIVYAVVPKEQVPKGASLWQYYHELGDGKFLNTSLHCLHQKAGKYNTFLAEAVEKMEHGAARFVKKHGFESLQRDHDLIIPLMIIKTSEAHAMNIIAWRTTDTENPTT